MKKKKPLVLIPGLLCDATLWQAQIEEFSAMAEIMVADHTRHDDIATIAAAILSEAPDHFALAGLSMGGYIAMEIMRQAPGRVTQLALLDTTAAPDPPERQKMRRMLMAQSEKGKFKGVTRKLLADLIHKDRLQDEKLTATIMQMAERMGRDVFLRQQKAILGRPDSRPDMPHYHCRTLILCGEDDALTPVEAHREMHALIPHSSLRIVAHCGHLSTLEDPGTVNIAMRSWLLGDG